MNSLLLCPRIGNRLERSKMNYFLAFLELTNEEYSCPFHYKKTDSFYKFVNLPFIKPVSTFEYRAEKSWKKSHEMLKKLFSNTDQIVVFSNQLHKGLNFKESANIKIRYDKTLVEDSFGTSFDSTLGALKCEAIPMFLAHEYNVPIKHIIYDPCEFIYNDIVPSKVQNYFFYALEKCRAKYLPYMEYSQIYKNDTELTEKEFDFSFGTTMLCEERRYLHSVIDKMRADMGSKKANFFYWSNYVEENTMVPYNEYLEYLRKSRFTLVIPSYDADEFSKMRFWEAIAKNCVPLVLDTCNIRDAFVETPEILKIVKEKLLVPQDAIVERMNSLNFLDVIKEIKTCSDYVKLKDIDYYKLHANKFAAKL